MRFRPPMLLLAALCAPLVGAATAKAEVTTTKYTMPANVSAGEAITTDAAGNVWFATTDPAGKQPPLGKFVPSQGVAGTSTGMTFTPTPTYVGASCCATQIRWLDVDDSRGRVWFSRSDGVYGFANSADATFSYGVTELMGDLYGVAYDAKTGRTWIAETSDTNVVGPGGNRAGNRIASTDSGLGALVELPNLAQQNGLNTFDGTRYNARPKGVTPDGQGQAWFVEEETGLPGYRIGHTTPIGYTEYAITPPSGEASGSGPNDVAVAKDGSVWFTNQKGNAIGRFDPAASTITQFSVANIDASLATGSPRRIVTASDGTLWVAEYGGISHQQANAILRIVPDATAPTATVYKTGAPSPLDVAPSVTGDVFAILSPQQPQGTIFRISGAIAGTGGTPGGETPGGGEPTPGVTSPAATPDPAPGAVALKPTTTTVARISPPTIDAVTVRQICVGPPQDRCALVYLLDSHDYVQGFPGTREALGWAVAPKTIKPKTPKPKTVELGRTEVSIPGGQTKDVKVSLSKKAKALLKKKQKLKVTLRVMEKQPDGTLKKISSKELTFKAKKPKKK